MKTHLSKLTVLVALAMIGSACGDAARFANVPGASENQGTTSNGSTLDTPNTNESLELSTDCTTNSDGTGCEENDTSATNNTSDSSTDSDGDGFASNVDCDDSDAEINPGVKEGYFAGNGGRSGHNGDGKDNNCDGTVDEVGPCGCNDIPGYAFPLEALDEDGEEVATDESTDTSATDDSTNASPNFRNGKPPFAMGHKKPRGPKAPINNGILPPHHGSSRPLQEGDECNPEVGKVKKVETNQIKSVGQDRPANAKIVRDFIRHQRNRTHARFCASHLEDFKQSEYFDCVKLEPAKLDVKPMAIESNCTQNNSNDDNSDNNDNNSDGETSDNNSVNNDNKGTSERSDNISNVLDNNKGNSGRKDQVVDNSNDDNVSGEIDENYIVGYNLSLKLLDKLNSDESYRNYSKINLKLNFENGKYLSCAVDQMSIQGSTRNGISYEFSGKKLKAWMTGGASAGTAGALVYMLSPKNLAALAVSSPLGMVTGSIAAAGATAVAAGVVYTAVEPWEADGSNFSIIFNPIDPDTFSNCKGNFSDVEEYMSYGQIKNLKDFEISQPENSSATLGIQSLQVKAITLSDIMTGSSGTVFYNNPWVEAYLNNNKNFSSYPNKDFMNKCARANVNSGFIYDSEKGKIFTMRNKADGKGDEQGLKYYPVSHKLIFTKNDKAVKLSVLTSSNDGFFDRLIANEGTEASVRIAFQSQNSCSDNSGIIPLFDNIRWANTTRTAYFYMSAATDAEIKDGLSLSTSLTPYGEAGSNLDRLYVDSIKASVIKPWMDDDGFFQHWTLKKEGKDIKVDGSVSVSNLTVDEKYETVKTNQ